MGDMKALTTAMTRAGKREERLPGVAVDRAVIPDVARW
jgi:hypothetical protein